MKSYVSVKYIMVECMRIFFTAYLTFFCLRTLHRIQNLLPEILISKSEPHNYSVTKRVAMFTINKIGVFINKGTVSESATAFIQKGEGK